MVAGAELLFRATHDSLTGISNRGVILDVLRRERWRQVRGNGSLGIVLLDVDHFKQVNADSIAGFRFSTFR
jgi:diguanylate cyclase (GGDEF)-like protein